MTQKLEPQKISARKNITAHKKKLRTLRTFASLVSIIDKLYSQIGNEFRLP